MSPALELNPNESNFLKWWLEGVGVPIEGQAFRVAFSGASRESGPPPERIVILRPDSIEADPDVLFVVKGYLAGPAAFQPVQPPQQFSPPLVEISPTRRLAELFPGARILNALSRDGIITVSQLRDILNREGGEADLLAIKHIGPKSVAEIKRQLLGQ